MRGFLRGVAGLALCCAVLLPLIGCAAGQNGKAQESGTSVGSYAAVWSAPSTVKIDQNDVAYEKKGEAALVFRAVKNEYESRQLLLTAFEDVDAYDLICADLTCGEAVLSKDNFTVYNERYTKMAEAAYGSYALPDALIPLDAARAHDELKVAKDQNAGLWVTVYIPEDTPAGVYEGSFELTVQDAKLDIPVQVTVSDYVLPDTTSGKTLFSWRYNRIGAGELDSSIEMMERYYEFFLDYRISLQSLPLESVTREEVKRVLQKYYDRLTTYTIGPDPGRVWGGDTLKYAENTKEMIYAIASISTPEKNYFDKAMLYVVDEPDLRDNEKFNYTLHTINSVNELLAQCVAEIRNDHTGAYDSFKSIDGWEDSILQIPNIMPLSSNGARWLVDTTDNEKRDEFLSAINTICPVFGTWTEQASDRIIALCEEYGVKNIWWYGCTEPLAPYGNYHIGDKNLLAARCYSWVQAKYGIQGNLYWDAAAYTSERPDWDQYMDVFENPVRITGVPAGDGFLTYPGAPYGVTGPLPSVRLMSIRDGMEELELLLALEKQYEALEETYGSAFSAHDSIVSLIDKVSYNGSVYYADGERGLDFDQVRGSLLDLLAWNEMGIGFALESVDIRDNVAEISYYISDGCKVYVNEELQQPAEGCRYAYSLDLTDSSELHMTIETADGTRYQVSRFIGFPTQTLQTFESADVLEGFTVSEGGAVELASAAADAAGVHIRIAGKITGVELVDAAYVPTMTMSTSLLENVEKLSDVDTLQLELNNPGEAFKLRAKIYAQDAFVSAGEYTVSAGRSTVSIPISDLVFSGIDAADRITFEFDNSADGTTANRYEFYLERITAAQ